MKSIIVFYLLSCLLVASSFETFSNTNESEYFNSIEMKEYMKVYNQAYEKYRFQISQNFPTVDMSDKNRWISYINNFQTKNIVDFENQKIIIQTYAKNMSEARQLISQRFIELVQMSIQEAFEEDFIEQEVIQQLQISPHIESDKDLLSDIYTPNEIDVAKNYIASAKIQSSQFENSNIYTMEIAMPSNALLQKAKSYKPIISKYAYENRLPMELIYAVIHSESSFNPMARSRTPAFGLMQIVPHTAGVDSYRFLYGKNRVLSASYLYNEEQNIKIGVAYLHLLFYRYFKDIENPLKRLYATVAAYNGGAGNLARTFVGTTDIKEAAKIINSMQDQELYNYLIANLPFRETREYLQRVNERIFAYRTWLLEN